MHILRLDRMKPVLIHIAGIGGTGSMLLPYLARINYAIQKLGGQGIHVHAFDKDHVSTANIGRQNFICSDVGFNKAITLISRINAMFGTSWDASPNHYHSSSLTYHTQPDIIVTCTDNVASREDIIHIHPLSHKQKMTYWLDCGNNKNSGQVILGNLNREELKQITDDDEPYLPHVIDMFPNMQHFEKQSGPSCSLEEALQNQDLMINPMIALQAANTIYHMLRNEHLTHHAWFIDLKRGATSPLDVHRDVWERMGITLPTVKPSQH